jgi:hypothetical protein
MLPKAVRKGRARAGRGRRHGKPLPVVIADLHVRIVAARLVAIVPDRPRPRWAGNIVWKGSPAGGRARGDSEIRTWRSRKTNADITAAVAIPATMAAAPMAMPVCRSSIARGGTAGCREIRRHRPLQEQCGAGCYRRGFAHSNVFSGNARYAGCEPAETIPAFGLKRTAATDGHQRKFTPAIPV